MNLPGFRMHHVGVAVADLEQSMAWYQEAMGLVPLGPPVEDAKQQVRVVFLGELELVAPLGANSPLFRYLKVDQSCYHICYEVDDLRAALVWLKSKKALVVSGPFPGPAFQERPLAWVYLPDKHLIELVEAPPQGSLGSG